MYILGVNSAYHESSACLVHDGAIVAAVEEERFNRIKHAKHARVDNADTLPEAAMDFCLGRAGIGWDQIDHIAYSFDPDERLARNVGLPGHQSLPTGDWGTEEGEQAFHASCMRAKQKLVGRAPKATFHFIRHHLCHASSAYHVSPFDEACVIAVDGIGEFATTWLGYGKGPRLELLRELEYPNSIGFMWEKFSELLGFDRYSGPGKLMGYSAITDAIGKDGTDYRMRMHDTITLEPLGFVLDPSIYQFRTGRFDGLEKLFGPRRPRIVYRYEEASIAAALQEVTEDVLVSLALDLYHAVEKELGHPVKRLAMAGGVALNCLANRAILERTPFEELFVQPAANDAGTAVGAAFHTWHQILGNEGPGTTMTHAYYGPEFGDDEIEHLLKEEEVPFERPDDMARTIARLIYDGAVVARFDGRLELGPRALGNRSILCDPTRFDMREIINTKVKYRESFRPFAPSVLDTAMDELFEPMARVPADAFMLLVYPTRDRAHMRIPAVIQEDECRHVSTSRAQMVTADANPGYYKIIEEFQALSGVGCVLNTSFNKKEPIICTPSNALRTFQSTAIDYLALGPYLVKRS